MGLRTGFSLWYEYAPLRRRDPYMFSISVCGVFGRCSLGCRGNNVGVRVWGLWAVIASCTHPWPHVFLRRVLGCPVLFFLLFWRCFVVIVWCVRLRSGGICRWSCWVWLGDVASSSACFSPSASCLCSLTLSRFDLRHSFVWCVLVTWWVGCIRCWVVCPVSLVCYTICECTIVSVFFI